MQTIAGGLVTGSGAGARILKVPGVAGANAYIVNDAAGGRLVLIDTGMPNNAGKIIQFLASIGRSESNVTTILITHPDLDHAGSLAELKERMPGARIGIHELDAPTLAGEKGPKRVKGFAGSMFKVFGGLMKLRPVKADILLKGGECLDGFTVVHTPGHTEGSACFYDEAAGVIFVGDALRTDGIGNLKKPGFNADDEKATKSMGTIASLKFEGLYPGHGAPITQGASEKLVAFVKSLG